MINLLLSEYDGQIFLSDLHLVRVTLKNAPSVTYAEENN